MGIQKQIRQRFHTWDAYSLVMEHFYFLCDYFVEHLVAWVEGGPDFHLSILGTFLVLDTEYVQSVVVE